jgi:alpha-glucosidase (family GH31 glycosyl hydrolase)
MRLHCLYRLAARTLPLLALAVLGACARLESGGTVRAGNARLQFLTPSLVRLEYSPSGKFVDAPTAVVLKRDWPPVRVWVTQANGWLSAATGRMTVRYRLRSGPFIAENLEVIWSDAAGQERHWHPGDTDPGNLGGLSYSLDNIARPNLPTDGSDLASPVNDMIPGIDLLLPPAKPGLLSRSGYAFIDDSSTPVWSASRSWIEPRPQPGGEDWYLFTYQGDYRPVLRDYAQLCGPVPMIPRYVLGAMITDLNFEYFPGSPEAARPEFQRYNQQHLVEEVTRLRQEHIPFDTLVLDFAWHNYGWDGGYDWSPLIPHPDQLLAFLHGQGVKLRLNDHPGYVNTGESILSFSDSHAATVLQALGRPALAAPKFDLDVSRGWSFATDPQDAGLAERWYTHDEHPGRWKPIRSGASWQEQGYAGYRGVGWYRVSVQLPVQLPAALYLYLGEVAQAYRIFVNGTEVKHSPAHWPRRLTAAELTPRVHPGANDIVLRVEPGEERGGLVRTPVAIRDVALPERIYFDLSDQHQAQVSMHELHAPLMRQGVDQWWVDGGSGAVDMPGLNPQLWTNKVFYDFSAAHSGRRAFILGRYGDWGSERYPGYFTGDTYSEWPVLAYEVAYTARGGNVLIPYMSHDIGGFHGAKIDFDLYARWIEFGTFSPLLRMHSAHANPREGNTRMPWQYGAQGLELMRKYFTLRTQLIPYLYTYSRIAHTDSLPLSRPLYLEYPQLEEAYRHPHEYLFGAEMLVAPVLDPSGEVSVYLPPGQWLDFFTGKTYEGGTTFSGHYAVDATPVLVKAGAIIPEQPPSEYSDANPLDTLVLQVYGAGAGQFNLYEDDGSSFDYSNGASAETSLTHTTGSDGVQRLLIEPTRGTYRGQPQRRGYQLRLHLTDQPAFVSVNGQQTSGWSWDAQQSTLRLDLPPRPIRERIEVTWR